MEYRLRWRKVRGGGWTSDSIPGYWVDIYSDGRVVIGMIGFLSTYFPQESISFEEAAPEIKRIMDAANTNSGLVLHKLHKELLG